MTSTPEIALTQLALWYDSSRIQTWPAFLASLPEDAMANSPTDLGRMHATQRMTSDRHSSAFNLVRNLPGLELRGGRIQLRGVGLLERSKEGYQASPLGRDLADAYRNDPSGTGWIRALADLLIGREPRTRALVWLLSQDGALLEFDGTGWFEGSPRKARIVVPNHNAVLPFADRSDVTTLAAILRDHGWFCLGDWREHGLLKSAEDCRLVGFRSESPSLHDIGLALRAALEVLLAAGIIRSSSGSAWIDTTAASGALPGRSLELGWRAAADESLVDALTAVLPELLSPTGHVVASELRSALQERGHPDPDRAIAEAEHEGHVLIYAEDYGQSRHGRGLYGDPRKQLVKLRIVGRGAP